MQNGSRLGCAALVVSIIGALNWGFVGLFHFDLIAFLFGQMTHFARVVYTLVGVSGLYALYTLVLRCKSCEHKG
jgi:uncharacterized membrane protein YuzA (DUF378 family)